jgi:hypothetical protein
MITSTYIYNSVYQFLFNLIYNFYEILRFFYNKIELSDDFDDAPIDKFNPQQVQRKKKQIEEMRKEKLKMIDSKK